MGCCKEKSTDASCSTEKTGSCGEKTGGCGDNKMGACGGKSQCCPGTIIAGAVVGGIVMFIWFSLSWMVLPWHHDVKSFTSDQETANLLSHVAPQSGVYLLPKMGDKPSDIKPFAFVSVFDKGVGADDMKKSMIKDFLLCLFGAALLTKIPEEAALRGLPCGPLYGCRFTGRRLRLSAEHDLVPFPAALVAGGDRG